MEADNTYDTLAFNDETGNKNNWSNPIVDEDELAPFCTPPDATDKTFPQVKCKEIKCVHERLLDTKDTVNDIKFSFTSSNTDKMKIPYDLALLYFNTSLSPMVTNMKGVTQADYPALEISVVDSAPTNLFTLSASTLAAIVGFYTLF